MPSTWLGRDSNGILRDFSADEIDENQTPAEVQGGSEQVVLSRSTTLTNAQIKALPGTDVEIVPAQGAGTVVLYVGGFVVCDTSAGYYEWAVPGDFEAQLYLRCGTGMVASARIRDLGNVLGAILGSEDVYAMALPPAGLVRGPQNTNVFLAAQEGNVLSGIENQPLSLVAENGGAVSTTHFTGGNAANFLTITVLYTVLDV
jgi:hypothetical protein